MDTDTLTHPSPHSCITSPPPSATRQAQGCSPNIPVPQTPQRRELMKPVGDPGGRPLLDLGSRSQDRRKWQSQEKTRKRKREERGKGGQREGKGDRAGGRREEADKENELGLVLIPCLLFISETNNYY